MCIRDRYQAGQSGRGVAFAARHAEGVFAIHPNSDACRAAAVSYTHLRAHETVLDLVCRLLLEKKK